MQIVAIFARNLGEQSSGIAPAELRIEPIILGFGHILSDLSELIEDEREERLEELQERVGSFCLTLWGQDIDQFRVVMRDGRWWDGKWHAPDEDDESGLVARF